MPKNDLVQELRDENLDLPIRKWDDSDIAGASVDDAKGFAFPSRRLSLTLEIHCESASRGIMRASSEKPMSLILPRFFHFAFWAIGKDASSVSP